MSSRHRFRWLRTLDRPGETGLYSLDDVHYDPVMTAASFTLAGIVPAGDEPPVTGGHNSTAVAAAKLDGRPVVISGGDDLTVRVWDLATGTPIRNPLTGHDGPVTAVAPQTTQGFPLGSLLVRIGVGSRNIATVSRVLRENDATLRWEQIAALEARSNILALALTSKRTLIAAAELGIIVFDLPSGPRRRLRSLSSKAPSGENCRASSWPATNLHSSNQPTLELGVIEDLPSGRAAERRGAALAGIVRALTSVAGDTRTVPSTDGRHGWPPQSEAGNCLSGSA
jgi:WD40 repeat protein